MSTWKNELLQDELPYEKYIKYGAKALSDAELLAIIIRTGTKNLNPVELARNVLQLSGAKRGLVELNHLNLNDLKKIPGIGKVKAIQLLCIAEIAKRISLETAKDGLDFNNSDSIASYFMEQLRHEEKENLILCMLDNRCQLIKEKIIFIGSVNTTICSPRDIFINALKEKASYIIVLHNHPSGDPAPSKQDILMTEQLKKASEIIDIPLLDHIIIGDNQYVSFNKLGLL